MRAGTSVSNEARTTRMVSDNHNRVTVLFDGVLMEPYNQLEAILPSTIPDPQMLERMIEDTEPVTPLGCWGKEEL